MPPIRIFHDTHARFIDLFQAIEFQWFPVRNHGQCFPEFCLASTFGSFIEIIFCLKSGKLFSNGGGNKLIDGNMVLMGKRPYSIMQ